MTFDGFISYAILVENNPEHIIERILIFQKCYKPFKNRVSIHLVWNAKRSYTISKDTILFYTNRVNIYISCNTHFTEKFSSYESRQFNAAQNELYPINIMRNIARKGASTGIQILSDIENIFSSNFSSNIQNTLYNWSKDKNDKSIFIFMRFETENGFPIPRNLQQLYESFLKQTTVTYHRYIFPRGHLITNFSKWYEDSIVKKLVYWRIIPYRKFYFEPQVIIRPFDPYHYENVPIRIYDQQILINELCHAGYIFKLLTHVFNVHPGIKREESSFEKMIKKIGMKNAPLLRLKFRKYLRETYNINNNKTTCPQL